MPSISGKINSNSEVDLEAVAVARIALLEEQDAGQDCQGGVVEAAVGEEEYDDEDADDDDDDDEELVRLGLVEEPEVPEALISKFFPSKVGGKPAWLIPRPLPEREDLLCSATPHGETCGRSLAFLMQVYAPLMDGEPESFHRTLFVFCCRNKTCQGKQGSAKVLRSQLPRQNDFYSYEAPEYPSAGPKITMIQDEEEKAAHVHRTEMEPENASQDTAVLEALECKRMANENFAAGQVRRLSLPLSLQA